MQDGNQSAVLAPRTGYDLSAEHYDSWSWQAFWRKYEFPVIRRLLKDAVRDGEPPAREALLDIGCGTGFHAGHLADLFETVAGVDISEGMLAVATRSYPGVQFRQASADDLPFESASFDAAISCRVLTHVEQLDPVFAEISRVMRSGGTLVVTNIAADHRYGNTRLPLDNDTSVEVATFKHSGDALVAAALRQGFALASSHCLDLWGGLFRGDACRFDEGEIVGTILMFSKS